MLIQVEFRVLREEKLELKNKGKNINRTYSAGHDERAKMATGLYTRCFIKKQPLLYFVISLHPKGRTV